MSSPPPLVVWLIGAGLVLIVVGLLAWSGALSWFGRLPGDVRYESESTRVYMPFVSMLLLSVAVSLILYVVRKFR